MQPKPDFLGPLHAIRFQDQSVVDRYHLRPTCPPVDLIAEFEQRRLFQKVGEVHTEPAPFQQPLSDYIEAFHAKSSLSRDYMTREAAAAFDKAMMEMLAPYAQEGIVTIQVVGNIVWGKPKGANI